MRRRHVLRSIGAFLAGVVVAARSRRIIAQDDATPVAVATAVLIDVEQRRVGTATLTEGAEAEVTITVNIEADTLAPGRYGLRFHETGICEPAGDVPFSSAGNLDPAEQDELGELEVPGDEAARFEITTTAVALDSLNDRDGSALILHTGDALDRVVCAVVYPPQETIDATPTEEEAAEGDDEEATEEESEASAEEVTVELVDIAFDPDVLTIPANTDVTVQLPNTGAVEHDFHIDELDVHSETVEPGGETTITINAEPGEYEYYCSIPGHREAGMVGTLRVE